METTKTSNFTCQSKSFISIFFTCQVSACELLPFFCHDLANDTYSQTAKTVFSHLNCSCKPGYSGNGHNCSGGCLRSFIYLLRLANPCRVTVTVLTELLGPVTVPSLMRNRPPHRDYVPNYLRTVRGFFIVPKNLFVQRLWDGDYDLSSLSEKTGKSNRLQIYSSSLFSHLFTL